MAAGRGVWAGRGRVCGWLSGPFRVAQRRACPSRRDAGPPVPAKVTLAGRWFEWNGADQCVCMPGPWVVSASSCGCRYLSAAGPPEGHSTSSATWSLSRSYALTFRGRTRPVAGFASIQPLSLSPGPHAWAVRAIDESGNQTPREPLRLRRELSREHGSARGWLHRDVAAIAGAEAVRVQRGRNWPPEGTSLLLERRFQHTSLCPDASSRIAIEAVAARHLSRVGAFRRA